MKRNIKSYIIIHKLFCIFTQKYINILNMFQ